MGNGLLRLYQGGGGEGILPQEANSQACPCSGALGCSFRSGLRSGAGASGLWLSRRSLALVCMYPRKVHVKWVAQGRRQQAGADGTASALGQTSLMAVLSTHHAFGHSGMQHQVPVSGSKSTDRSNETSSLDCLCHGYSRCKAVQDVLMQVLSPWSSVIGPWSLVLKNSKQEQDIS